MGKLPKIRPQFRASLAAQGIAFILNITLFVLTNNYFFIWTELACFCFFGGHIAKSPTFIDRNILNHFISVMAYYLISLLIEFNNTLYLCLIFSFTYVYFILRNNGYHKSFNLYMYIQALLIGTTFTSYPFHDKILATIVAYIEAQLILNLAFKFTKVRAVHETELRYHHVFKISAISWLDFQRPEVRLAIRGAFTAAILYALCSSFHDMKPNWAVVAALSCLQRDDYTASLRAIKGVGIGSLLGWPLAAGLIYILTDHIEISTALIWIFMLSAMVCSFELFIRPRLWLQILNSVLVLISVICVGVSLQIKGLGYLDLKVLNSLIGIVVAMVTLLIWQKMHKFFADVRVR
jgi:hypothetical protein